MLRSVPAQGSLELGFEMHGIFSNRDLTFHLWVGWAVVTKGNNNRLFDLGVSYIALANHSKECFSYFV